MHEVISDIGDPCPVRYLDQAHCGSGRTRMGTCEYAGTRPMICQNHNESFYMYE